MSEYDFLKDEDNIKLVGKISNLIDDWHREFKGFTMKNTHFINDYYIQRNNF
mgnify:CR=1 FL=1